MMTIAEQWVQQGWEKGRQEGLESQRQLVLRMVRKKFVPATMEQSRALLENLTESTVLENLGEDMLDCADGEAWLAMLARQGR